MCKRLLHQIHQNRSQDPRMVSQGGLSALQSGATRVERLEAQSSGTGHKVWSGGNDKNHHTPLNGYRSGRTGGKQAREFHGWIFKVFWMPTFFRMRAKQTPIKLLSKLCSGTVKEAPFG